MVEQFGADPSAHGPGPRGHDPKPPAIAAHGIVPGRNSSLPTRCAVNDAERLDELGPNSAASADRKNGPLNKNRRRWDSSAKSSRSKAPMG